MAVIFEVVETRLIASLQNEKTPEQNSARTLY